VARRRPASAHVERPDGRCTSMTTALFVVVAGLEVLGAVAARRVLR
jgi:hypothetical protein